MALSREQKILLLAVQQNTKDKNTQEEHCVTENTVSDNVCDKTEIFKVEGAVVEGSSKWVTVPQSENTSDIKLRLCRVNRNPPKGNGSLSSDSTYEKDVDNSDEDPNFTYSSSDSSEDENSSIETSDELVIHDAQLEGENVINKGVPNDVAVYWHQYPWTLGEPFCKLRALFSEMASYVSVLTIVSFSTERYLSICHPLYLYTMVGLQRAVRIIACLWVVSFLAALPFALYTNVNYLKYPPDTDNDLEESAFCAMLSQPKSVPLAELSTLIFFILPMIVIAIQYTKMGLKISKRTQQTLGKSIRGSVHRDSRKSHSHRIIIRMLAAVVVGFFICWAPFHAQRLLYIYGKDWTYYNEINAWMFYITGILYYFSSTLNPILYNIMSNRYRTAFKEILCGVGAKHGNLGRRSTLRDTKVSHSETVKIDEQYLCRMPSQRSTNTSRSLIENDEKCRLVAQEIAKPIKGTLVYQINCKNAKEYGLNSHETCI